jgi:hypothetical protein
MQKKRTARIAAVFFTALALLTFFSRTIYRGMLPNVRVASATGGILEYVYTAYDIQFKGESSVSIHLPALYSRPLTVNEVFVKPGQHVVSGEALIAFHAPDGEYLLDEAEKEYGLAAAALTLFETELARRTADLGDTIAKTGKKAVKARLEEDMIFLQAGIMDGTTGQQLEFQVASWEKTTISLQALKDNQWQLKAPAEGLVLRVFVKEDDSYSGLNSLISLCPQGAQYSVGCLWKAAPVLRWEGWLLQGTIQGGLPLHAMDAQAIGADVMVWFKQPEDAPYPDQITSVELRAASPYYSMLVDNSAFSNDTLFTLKSKTGAWGQTEYYIKEAKVVKGPQDDTHTAILSGLGYNEALITSSNRPLKDGQPVLPESFE